MCLLFRLKQLKAVEKLVSLITNQPEEVNVLRRMEEGKRREGRREGGRGRREGEERGISYVMHVHVL